MTGISARGRSLLVGACVVVLGSTVVFAEAPPAVRGAAAALVVAQGLALWLLAARPAVATALVIALGVGAQLLVPMAGLGMTAVALSTLAWLRPPRRSLWAPAVVVVLAVAGGFASGDGVAALLVAAAAALAWTWGELARVAQARRRAETRRAILEERARIARELHDVLAHTVSVMVVQAGAADDVFDVHPEQARAAVRAVETTGRQAQAELRQLLQAVRLDEGAAPPQPGFAELPQLVETVGRAGLPVALRVDGPVADVPPGVALSAYRIAQESLTNCVRHAAASRAQLCVRVGRDDVLVDVRDDGPVSGGGHGERAADRARALGMRGGGPGRGIVGMRERAATLGGTLEAGPAPDGGWRVVARLPLRGPA